MRYYGLKKDVPLATRRKFVVEDLIALKTNMSEAVPSKSTDQNLLIATWNIRDFDSNKFGHGYRLNESYYFIAQILSSFDLIAVQEINKNLDGLNRLMYILGPNWDFLTTDVTDGSSGNGERMTFIYDLRRVSFKKIAGEIVLPKNKQIHGDVQFARTPFIVSFQSGWSKFSLCTVHIYFGSETGEDLQRRINEIDGIAKFLKKRADDDLENLLILGDFNIVSPEHKTMRALIDNGFEIPSQIRNKPVGTNTFQTKHYDQIGIRAMSRYFNLGSDHNSAGSYNFYEDVLKESDFEHYREHCVAALNSQKETAQKAKLQEAGKANPDATKLVKLNRSIANFNTTLASESELKEYYFREWKTFQISDHLPMWVEISIDHSNTYLRSI
jgi:endonuclease/exonuclease/phosphatase family metal-dependent hydrolase